jgi:opacity protein-like surface antigen
MLNSDKDESYGYGLDLLAGVEYRLYKNVILSGEYGFSVEFQSGKYKYIDKQIYEDTSENRISERTGEKDVISLDTMSVILGIAIFF